ncbi:Na+/H+ antiporter NhaC family protein [Alkalicoccus luteus]|uniref:Na+/H+ antiporter NhaC family protein n=1 Tax=Alkalicoccus luteus TaxID=1237094 RepID=UPI004033C6BE
MTHTYSTRLIAVVFICAIAPLMTAAAFELPLGPAMLPGLAAAAAAILYKGASVSFVSRTILKGMSRSRAIAWLLVFIGLLLPAWTYAGIVDDLNQLFLAGVHPGFFLTASFLIATVMSLTVGSAVGSLSIVGIPLIGAGTALGVSPVLLGGALVSGAFVGDRTSPLSSSFQLLAFASGLTTRDHLRTITPTLLISVPLTACLFLVIDLLSAPRTGLADEAMPAAGPLFLSLLPPLLLLGLIVRGKSMYTCFTAAIAAGSAIAFLRGGDPISWIIVLWRGTERVNGLMDMLPFVLFILIVGAFCQLLEDTDMLQPLLKKVFHGSESLSTATLKTTGAAASVALVSPNQSFPILLAGRTMLPYWRQSYGASHLARILADSTVVFAGLVPWSLLAILCSTIIQVPVTAYAPAAVFLWLSPFVTAAYSSWLSASTRHS